MCGKPLLNRADRQLINRLINQVTRIASAAERIADALESDSDSGAIDAPTSEDISPDAGYCVDVQYTTEGISITVYGPENEVHDETWHTWDEIETRRDTNASDFTAELPPLERGSVSKSAME